MPDISDDFSVWLLVRVGCYVWWSLFAPKFQGPHCGRTFNEEANLNDHWSFWNLGFIYTPFFLNKNQAGQRHIAICLKTFGGKGRSKAARSNSESLNSDHLDVFVQIRHATDECSCLAQIAETLRGIVALQFPGQIDGLWHGNSRLACCSNMQTTYTWLCVGFVQ